jgi:hypothetical protein
MAVPRPQVVVFQEFQPGNAEIVAPLRPFVFGPEYKLHRYTGGSDSEKSSPLTYDNVSGNTSTWLALGRAVGAVVDQNYTRVFLENAHLEYYRNEAGTYTYGPSGSSSSSSSYTGSPDSTATAYSLPNYPNKLYLTGVNLKDVDGFALDAAFHGRDVKVGDHVKVWQELNGTTHTSQAKVAALEADTVASIISTAAKAAGNAATNASATAAGSVTKGGTVNDVTISVTATAYDGLLDGVLTETYTVKVRRGTTGGDARTAVLDIVSSSGRDNVTGLVPPSATMTQTLDLGTRGATFAFSLGGETDLTAGQTFAVTLTQQFYAPTPTANAGSGTYTGTKDDTYVLTVIRGGAVDATDKPRLSVTTVKGTDSGSPITVAAAATPYAVGNRGVTVEFAAASGTLQFRKGDQYTIAVAAEGDGAFRTIVLDRSIDTNLRSTSTQTFDLNVALSIEKDVELPRLTDYVENWAQDADGITVYGSASLFDSTWRDGEVALPIASADVYVHWRELLAEHVDKVYSLDQIGDLTDLNSQLDRDNPLGYALSKTALNANGTSIRYMAVASDDLDGYLRVLNAIETRSDVYTLVPLTKDLVIQQAVRGHVTAMSSPEVGLWRTALLVGDHPTSQNVLRYEDDGETPVTATTSGTTLTLAEGSTAGFITAGIRPGDTVRYRIGTDGTGNAVYESSVIDYVVSEQQLELVEAPDTDLGADQSIEIWRTMDAQDLADDISDSAGVFKHRRVGYIYPDKYASGGVEVEGFHMAAAIAGFVGGVAPHQGATNITINGFDNANRTVQVFNRSQLDQMASAGVWLVVHDLDTGEVYSRHGISTDVTDVNSREWSITKNVDSISYLQSRLLQKFIGRANNTPTVHMAIRTELEGVLASLRGGDNPLLGGQLIDGTVDSVVPHPTLKDQIVVTETLEPPAPANRINVNLIVK